MAYAKKNKKTKENYLQNAKNGMTPMIDGKKMPPNKKKK
jgi:hypothetical protein